MNESTIGNNNIQEKQKTWMLRYEKSMPINW